MSAREDILRQIDEELANRWLSTLQRGELRLRAVEAVERIVDAGAEPPLQYQGMGSEGIVLCDQRGRAFKASLRHGRSYLADEAEYLADAARIPELQELVASFIAYRPEVDVIERECVREAESASAGLSTSWYDAYRTIKERMRERGWGAPEGKSSSFVVADRGPVLVDAGHVRRYGERLLQFVEDAVAGLRPWGSDTPAYAAMGLRRDYPDNRSERVQRALKALGELTGRDEA